MTKMSESEIGFGFTNEPSLEHNLRGHKKSILGLAFNPNEKQLASCGSDHSLMLWNLTSKNVRCYEFKGHTDVVTGVVFSSDGKFMASCSQDRTVRLWVPTMKGGSVDFRAHSAAVRTINFSPDNEQLLTGSNDKCIKIWNVQFRRFLSSYLGHTNWIRCAQYSPDGRLIASCADDKTIRLWDVNSTQCLHTFFNSKGSGNFVSFHRSGYSVAVAMNSGSVRIYDMRNYKLQQHYSLHDNATCVVWHPSTEYFLSSGLDGTLKIVDALEGRPVFVLKGHEGPINQVRFDTKGDYFASVGSDQHVMVWKTSLAEKLISPTGSLTSSSSASQESV